MRRPRRHGFLVSELERRGPSRLSLQLDALGWDAQPLRGSLLLSRVVMTAALTSQGIHSFIHSFNRKPIKSHDVPEAGLGSESTVNKTKCLALKKYGKHKLEIVEQRRR